MLQYDPKTGVHSMAAEDNSKLMTLIQGVIEGQYPRHKLSAEIIGPIRQTAAYSQWTGDLFATRNVAMGSEWPRVATSNYIAQAWMTSLDGTARYVRPGRKYTRPSFQGIMAGMMWGWYDAASAGWDYLQYHVSEVGEELARKRDAMAETVIDAFFTANPSRVVTSPGGLSRQAVDTVIRAAVTAKFPVTRVILNPADALDIAQWTGATNALWQPLPERYGDQVIREGWVSTYGGLTWTLQPWCPSGEVYLTGDPTAGGQFHFEYGSSRQDSEDNIDNATTRTVYREQHGYLIVGGMSLYKINIV